MSTQFTKGGAGSGNFNHAGVYAIRNVASGCLYIGSSVNCINRWRNHRNELEKSKHGNGRIQKAWCDDGEEAFVFEVLLNCPQDELMFWEQLAIDAYREWVGWDMMYNISAKANPGPVGITPSAETRLRLSKAQKGKLHGKEWNEKVSEAKRGMKYNLSISTRESLASAARNTWKGRKQSEDHVKKRKASQSNFFSSKRSAEFRRKASLCAIEMNKQRGPVSEETRRKISVAGKGKPKTQEHKDKIGAAQKGKPKNISPEGLERLRAAATGKTPYDATKKKMAEKSKAYWESEKGIARKLAQSKACLGNSGRFVSQKEEDL